MPCFSSGPTPGTHEYAAWLPDVSRKLDSFIHVVDYYFGKAGIRVPEPGGAEPVEAGENASVLHQILLHLDCDDVDVFQLNDIRNLLHNDPASKGHRYTAVLVHCFAALRNGFRQRPTNDAQWRACRNPALMLDGLGDKVSGRKLRLFAVACCRRVPHLFTDERGRNVVDVAERFAEGHATAEELAAAEQQAEEAWGRRRDTDSPASWAADASAAEAARSTAWWAADDDYERESEAQAALLRCVAGSPFRPVAFPGEWRTETAVSLAQQMYESRDFGAMPILADALQDVGCDSEDVLNHCRGEGPHVRGCWVVDLVLGKE